MKQICSGCGSEIPEGSDFCYACGAWAKNSYKVNDEGTILYLQYCMKCGKELVPGAEYCSHCGAKTKDSEIPININRSKKLKMTNLDFVAILLAVVPGLFNIFGLGQVIQRRWSKAFVYVCATAIFLYIYPAMMESSNGRVIMIALQIGFFIMSVLDVFKGIATKGA